MLLALLYWKDERSFDNFHRNNPNLYRVTTTLVDTKGEPRETRGGTGQVQGAAFKLAVPELKSFTRVLGGDIFNDIAANNKTLRLRPLYVDANFLETFSFPLIHGDPKTALNSITSVVITESTARKFFGTTDVVGKTFQLSADPSYEKLGKPLIVSAVAKNPPPNSSLQFDLLYSFEFMRISFEDDNWLNAYLGTFVVLQPGADIEKVTKKFDQVFAIQAKKQLADIIKTYGYDPQINYGLQPVTEMHLNPLLHPTWSVEGGVINGSNPVYSYMFMGIAIFILLMASINFVNISIANSLRRIKEVGVRKISGASRLQILSQFLFESSILCLLAFALSLFAMDLALHFFNRVTGKEITLSSAVDLRLVSYFLLGLVLIILTSGLYPALVLSRFKPSEVLYNKQKLSGRNFFGRGLVILQFTLAVSLLIATIIYYQQMSFIQTKDLGYNPGQIIRTAIGGDRDYKSAIDYLRNELKKEPSISMVSFGDDGHTNTETESNNRTIKVVYKNIDENYLPLMQIPLLIGRNFSSTADSRGVAIVNEAFVKAAGLDDPLHSTLKVNYYSDSTNRAIVGVVKDFHFGSLREPIKPIVMYLKEVPDGGVWVKAEKMKQQEAMTALARVYKAAMPDAVYEYKFLDELNASQYLQEHRWQQIISAAVVLAFLICSLGLFGLAHLSTQRRVKEIGIRKVLGATATQVVALLSRDFLKLVLIAFVIASPIAYLVISKWLENYAYRIEIGPWAFVIAATVAIGFAFAAIIFQSIKSALSNPVYSLRTE